MRMPAVDDVTITAEGFEQLCAELETLRTDGRREMTERLREARDDAHAEDTPALFDAFEDQAQLEQRIAVLEHNLGAARIAKPSGNGAAGIGSVVRLRDLEEEELLEYTLVGAIEGNPGLGRVSVTAPVGRALIAATAGQVVSVECPSGERRFEVVSVETPSRASKKAA